MSAPAAQDSARNVRTRPLNEAGARTPDERARRPRRPEAPRTAPETPRRAEAPNERARDARRSPMSAPETHGDAR